MAEETITILRVGTEEAVRNIADLKNNIKALKEGFEDAAGKWHDGLVDLEIGTKEYQDTLDELKVNQNALKDAMYATSSSMEDVAAAATGTSKSYNSLVHQMASLKEEFRATNDEMRRAELGKQIKEVNDQLKDLDALQGNFQRNVGNYAGGIKDAFGDLAKKTDAFGKALHVTNGNVNGFKDSFEAFGKSPAIATIGILVSVAMKLADSLKDNETAMAALKKGMTALEPVMDFLSGIIDTLANVLADIIGKVATFVTSNGLFSKIISGVMGVGNAVLQFIIAPFKGIVAAIKVFQEEGVKGIGNAAKAFGTELKSGVSFKQNFQAGQAVADTMVSGAQSRKKKVKDAGKDMGKEMKDGLLEELSNLSAEIDKQLAADLASWEKAQEEATNIAQKAEAQRLSDLEKAYAHQLELNDILTEDDEERAEKAYEIQLQANQKRLSLLDQFMQDALDRDDMESYLAYDRERADLQVEIETDALREKQRIREKDLKDAEEKAQAQKALLQGVASTTSAILGSIADIYEEDEENSEKNANKIKALRIAAATIDTISGAIGAFMQASQTIPPPYGQIVGAAQAAAVTAAGLAQIASMKAVKVSGSSGSASAPAVPAVATAPSIPTDVTSVRNVTSASEETRLNQMAQEQRVYILASDIEASQNQIKTRVSESSF